MFQDLDSSPLCDAIELVTPGYKDANFSHIGLVVLDNDKLKVLEAIPPKVVLTDIKSFFNRSYDRSGSSKIKAGRLKDEFQNTIKDAIIEGGKTRITPVMLTATAAILGLFPLAIGFNIVLRPDRIDISEHQNFHARWNMRSSKYSLQARHIILIADQFWFFYNRNMLPFTPM